MLLPNRLTFVIVLLGTQLAGTPERDNYKKAVEALTNKKNDLAIALFSDVVNFNPKNGSAFVGRGVAYTRKKEYAKALKDYAEGILLNPKDWTAYYHRGNSQLQQNEYDKAITDFTEVIRLKPGYIYAYTHRGFSYTAKRKHGQAIRDYTKALELDPTFASANVHRGFSYMATKQYGQAIADFKEAIRLDPKDLYPYLHLGWLFASCADDKLRDSKKALEYAKKACAIAGKETRPTLNVLAAAHAEAGDFEEAVKVQKKALRIRATSKKEEQEGIALLKLYVDRKPYRVK